MRNRLLPILAAAVLALVAFDANATVLTENRSKDFTCSGTSVFVYDFPVLSTADLVVTKYTGSCGSATSSLLAIGTDYTATRTATGGTVTLAGGTVCNAGYCMRIERDVDFTQETSFKSQGTFNPSVHEAAFDKLTMEVQELTSGIVQSADTAAAIATHIASADDHTMYLKLAGRTGGQVAYGSTLAGEDLTLAANPVSGGSVNVSGILAVAANLLAGGAVHAYSTLLVDSTATFDGGQIYGNNTSLSIDTDASPAGFLYLGADTLTIDEANAYVGIGDTTPDAALDVVGSALVSGTVTATELVGTTSVVPTMYGSKTTAQNVTIVPNSAAANGKIILGSASAYDHANTRLGIGTTSPSVALDVTGQGLFSSNLRTDGTLTVNGTSAQIGDSNMTLSSSAVGTGYLYGGDQSNGDLYLAATSDGTKTSSYVYLGSAGNSYYAENADDLVIKGYSSVKKPLTNTAVNLGIPTSAADCNRIVVATADGLTFTLADITSAYDGCQLTFLNAGAAAAYDMTVAIDASDYIVGTCLDSSKAGETEADFFTTSSHKGIYLQKAGSQRGDHLTVVADASLNMWLITSCIGFWIQIP